MSELIPEGGPPPASETHKLVVYTVVVMMPLGRSPGEVDMLIVSPGDEANIVSESSIDLEDWDL